LLPRSCAIFAAYVAALAGFTVAIVADDELGTVGGVNGQVFSFPVARTRTIGAMIAWIGLGNARQAFAISGAGAFLASSNAMPLTAIILTIEFTRINHDMWMPITIAVASSEVTFRFCVDRETNLSGVHRPPSLGAVERNRIRLELSVARNMRI
jgi:Voltage gated chloride channel